MATSKMSRGHGAFDVIALDPETQDRDVLGVWRFDAEWGIEAVEGIGEYQEMLEEIAEDVNDQDELAAAGEVPGAKRPSLIARGDPRFLEALRAYLKLCFDLELIESKAETKT